MGKMKDSEMFSGLTSQELQLLFAKLGHGASAGRYHYAMASEIGQVQADVHQALIDVTRATFAEPIARAEAGARDPELQELW
jgi:hypothetical protein